MKKVEVGIEGEDRDGDGSHQPLVGEEFEPEGEDVGHLNEVPYGEDSGDGNEGNLKESC